MENVITNDNISDLVSDYIENRNNLPAWLQGIAIGDWDVSRVTRMRSLFRGFTTFNEPLTNWDVSNVTNMECMFEGCLSFNQPLNNWDVSNVIEMAMMFSGCEFFNQPLGNWNVSNVRSMTAMFNECDNFNQPLNGWNVSNVRFMSDMFRNCDNFNQPLNGWNVSRVESMRRMFAGCLSFNQPLNNWDVSNVRDMLLMFRDCTSFNQDLSNWNVSRVTYGEMNGMFRGCTSLTINPNWQLDPLRQDVRSIFENTGIPGAYRPYRPQPTQPTQQMQQMPQMPQMPQMQPTRQMQPTPPMQQTEPRPQEQRQQISPLLAFAHGLITVDEVAELTINQPEQFQTLAAFARGDITPEQFLQIARFQQNQMRHPELLGVAQLLGQPRGVAQPAPRPGVAWEIHNAFSDLDIDKFMKIIRRENNGASNFKNSQNILRPLFQYINSSDTTLTPEQKTRIKTNFRKKKGIIENVEPYIREHPEAKDSTLDVIQFVLSQDPKYKDLYIETFENECMGAYTTGDGQSCTKGMWERIFLANKGTIEGLCFDELQSNSSTSASSTSASSSSSSSCKPLYLELYSTFTPGADIDINDIFMKWYNQFSYDAIPEEENPLKNLSVDARKQHFRGFVRQDPSITPRIWQNRDFQKKLEKSIEDNNIIFKTLNSDAGLGGRKRTRYTIKTKMKKRQNSRKLKTMKKQRKVTMKRLKRNGRKTIGR